MDDGPDNAGRADQPTLAELLGPALDRCSALADELAKLLVEPR